jgi:hypothetical protein
MFPRIGTFDIVAEGDVIHVRSTPQFNLEAVQEYSAKVSEVITHMPQRFGILAEFENQPIVGPEVEQAMRETSRQRAARGLAAVAFVTPGHDGQKIAIGQWHRIYDPLGIAFAFFDDVESARTWLLAKIKSDA